MGIRIAEIARITGAVIEGNADIEISLPGKLEEADNKTLCFFANPKYEAQLYVTKAAAVIVPFDFKPAHSVSFALIRHANPYFAFCMVLNTWFNPNQPKKGIEIGSYIHSSAIVGNDVFIGATAYVDEDANIGNNTQIYPQVFVGNGVVIGENCTLFPGVKIYAGCKIGNNCIIHAGTVIGSDGFGFAPIGDTYAKIPQIGNVIIEDDVEIGSNCSIDRATMGSTIIRRGTKLDNLIQVAHNAEIGANTVIASQTGVSGSTKIGANCQIGGQVGFVGHINIADRTGIGAQSGVTKTIEETGTNWIGSPASPIKEQFRSWAAFKKLPDMLNEMKQLARELEKLKDQKDNSSKK
jgi:UDP-3-O-[3-hydroxymyristoyl] glucosamine N-acyltransferase